MNIEMISANMQQDALQPTSVPLASLKDFVVPSELDDITGAEIEIEELLTRLHQITGEIDVAEEIGEPTVILYGMTTAKGTTTSIRAVTALDLVIKSITAKYGVSGYKVRLK